MKKISLVASLILLICMFFSCQTTRVLEVSGPKSLQGPEGVYLAKTSTPNGEVEFTITINADGTGSLKSMMGSSDFSDGKIESNMFTFNVTMNTQMGEMALSFKGAVDGDNVSGTIGTQMGKLPFSGQRKI